MYSSRSNVVFVPILGMAGNELKEKGNAHFIKGRFEKAAECYSDAIELEPTNHVLYSNRSAAFSNQKRFSEALKDANKCIEIAPTFARGYLRNATALNGLGKYEEAMEAAQKGYKLRGSSKICKDCVSQWLIANQAIQKEILDELGAMNFQLPTGMLVLSQTYLHVLVTIAFQQSQSVGAFTDELLQQCLSQVFCELDKFLKLFGHSSDPSEKRWVEAVGKCSCLDPRTMRVPTEVAQEADKNADSLSAFFSNDVDPALFPILSPLVALVTTAIVSRIRALNAQNTGHHIAATLARACLPFFERSLLSTPEYIGHHLGMVSGLLEAYAGSDIPLSKEDLDLIAKYSERVETLLQQYSKSSLEYEAVTSSSKRALSYINARIGKTTDFKFSEDPTTAAELSGRTARMLVEKRPEEVKSYITKKLKEVETHAFPDVSSIEDLIRCTGALLDINDKEGAVNVFEASVAAYTRLFMEQAQSGALSLDDARSVFTLPRMMVLMNAFLLRDVNAKLVANILVQWKCLYSEFRAILIRLGLGGSFVKTFQNMQELQLEQGMQKIAESRFKSLALQHQQFSNEVLKKEGRWVLFALSKHSCQQIQKLLQPDQAIIDYCEIWQFADPKKHSLDSDIVSRGLVMALYPKGDPVIQVVEFSQVQTLSDEWREYVNLIFTNLAAGSGEDARLAQDRANQIAQQICDLLFPDKVREVVNNLQVKRIFVCPDGVLTTLPLEVLLFRNGKMLGEKCSITYLSSSRELLRELTSTGFDNSDLYGLPKAVEKLTVADHVKEECDVTSETKVTRTTSIDQGKLSDLTTETAAPGVLSSAESQKCTTIDSIRAKSTECFIFADPNFSLEKCSSDKENTAWTSFIKALSSFYETPLSVYEPVPSLPESMNEAREIEQLLSLSQGGILQPSVVSGDKATIEAVMKVESPFIIHFSTHGFSNPPKAYLYSGNFWSDSTSGLLLAGANTYRLGKYERIVAAAGTGALTSVAACGLNLQGTRLVYLSSCLSSFGHTATGESLQSLAQAFRAAGAQTVVATLWSVTDEAAKTFATIFYKAACRPGVPPSIALTEAKQTMRKMVGCRHWVNWAPFVCIGYDLPIFPLTEDTAS